MELRKLEITTTSRKPYKTSILPRNLTDIVQHRNDISSVAIMRKHGELDEVNAEVGLIILNIFKHYGESIEPQIGLSLRDTLIKLGYMLTSLDFHLFKQYAMEGKYKNRVDIIEDKEFAIKFFKLTPDTLVDWFKIYIFDRGEEFARLQAKPKIQGVSEVTAKYVELIKPFIKDVYEDKLKEKPDFKKTEPVLSPEDQYKKDLKDKVQSIYNEFKALQVEQNSRIVEVNGKFYDYNEYLKLRTNGNNTN